MTFDPNLGVVMFDLANNAPSALTAYMLEIRYTNSQREQLVDQRGEDYAGITPTASAVAGDLFMKIPENLLPIRPKAVEAFALSLVLRQRTTPWHIQPLRSSAHC